MPILGTIVGARLGSSVNALVGCNDGSRVGTIIVANVGLLKTVNGRLESELALSIEASEGKAVDFAEGPEGSIVGKAVGS